MIVVLIEIAIWTLMSFIAVAVFAYLLSRANSVKRSEILMTRPQIRVLANARVRDLSLMFVAMLSSLIIGVAVVGDVLFDLWDVPLGLTPIALIVMLACNTAVGVLGAHDENKWGTL